MQSRRLSASAASLLFQEIYNSAFEKKEKNRVLRLKKELRASPVPRLFSFSSLAQFSRLSRMTLGRGLVPLDLHGPQWQEFEFKDVFSIFTYATVRATQWYFWLVD